TTQQVAKRSQDDDTETSRLCRCDGEVLDRVSRSHVEGVGNSSEHESHRTNTKPDQWQDECDNRNDLDHGLEDVGLQARPHRGFGLRHGPTRSLSYRWRAFVLLCIAQSAIPGHALP